MAGLTTRVAVPAEPAPPPAPRRPLGAPRVALLNYGLNEASRRFRRDADTLPPGHGFSQGRLAEGGRAGQENASRRHPWEPRAEMETPASSSPALPRRALSFPAPSCHSKPLLAALVFHGRLPSVTAARRKAAGGAAGADAIGRRRPGTRPRGWAEVGSPPSYALEGVW